MYGMKRSGYIVLMVCMVVVTVSAIVLRVPRTVPLEECSEVYKRYYKVEGVRATYVKNYPLNDTLTIGVTLLEATDSAGWEYLLEAFNIPHELTEIADIDVWTWQALRNHPEERYNSMVDDRQVEKSDLEIVSISTKDQEICIFHTRNEQERSTIFSKKIEANI